MWKVKKTQVKKPNKQKSMFLSKPLKEKTFRKI